MKTVFPRLSAHDLISALPRVSAYPLLHQGSYIQGFLYSGVYISVSYMTVPCTDVDIDRCSLHSGVQINVSYMTGPWPDVVIDRKILWSGVCVNRKFLHLVCILWSDVDINLTMSHPRWINVEHVWDNDGSCWSLITNFENTPADSMNVFQDGCFRQHFDTLNTCS